MNIVFNGQRASCIPIVTGSPLTYGRLWTESKYMPTGNYDTSYLANLYSFPRFGSFKIQGCSLDALQMANGLETFEVEDAKCTLGQKTYVKGEEVSYDLNDFRNYPKLTKPRQ